MQFKKLSKMFFLIFLPIVNLCDDTTKIDPMHEMAIGSEEGNRFKEYLFGARKNLVCKPNEPFCPSLCHYPTNLAYNYFAGNAVEHSLIPSQSFFSEAELNKWAVDQNKDTYLIAYKKGCPPCANLLAAIETRAQDLKSSNKNLFKINVQENQDALGKNCWGYQGTPTVWKINQGKIAEIPVDLKARNFYQEFIHLRQENKIPENKWEYLQAICASQAQQKWIYGFGYFQDDAKVLTACVAAGLLYGSYKLFQKWQNPENKPE